MRRLVPTVVIVVLAALGAVLLAGGGGGLVSRHSAGTVQAHLAGARATRVLLQLPLAFEPNWGQTDPRVRFVANAPNYTVLLTGGGAVLGLHRSRRYGTALNLQFLGSSGGGVLATAERLPGRVSYLIGDRARWQRDLPTFAQVRQRRVWPGIDVVWHGNPRRLEYDLVVGPGADPARIRLGWRGASRLSLDRSLNLVIGLPGGGVLRQPAPVAYQQIDGARMAVAARYVLVAPNRVSIRVGGYDRRRPLLIDPGLVYSTYLGGSNADEGSAIAVDANGDAYITGTTYSSDFPTTPGAFQTTGSDDAFVTKLNASGSALVYSTYLGGSGGDDGTGIAVDASGNAYVTGETNSLDFPTTPDAYNPGCRCTANPTIFLTKFNASGTALVYSILLGTRGDTPAGIAVDPRTGDAYVTGMTSSSAFPTTPGAYQTTLGGSFDAFVTKLNASGSALAFSTYLGGTAYDYGTGIAVDPNGDAYVTGSTESSNFPSTPGAFQTTLRARRSGFVTKLNPSGTGLAYSTYLGGNDVDEANAIAVDATGDAYITGDTGSSDFPTTPGVFQTSLRGGSDAFVTKLDAGASALVYSTYLGGGDADFGHGIVVNGSGDAYVTGISYSSDFPTTLGAFQTSLRGSTDAFVTTLNTNGTALRYSSYLGGSNDDFGGVNDAFGNGIAVDASGNAYVTGVTYSDDFPTTPGAFQNTLRGAYNAFVTKVNVSPGCTMTGAGVFRSGLRPRDELSGHHGKRHRGRLTDIENALTSDLSMPQTLVLRTVKPPERFFRLASLSAAACSDNPAYPREEDGTYNTLTGSGTGSFGVHFPRTARPFTIQFEIGDLGDGASQESTTADSVSFTVKDARGTVVWQARGTLYSGQEEESR